jgi:membrane protease YdiL (CAAX protease family)
VTEPHDSEIVAGVPEPAPARARLTARRAVLILLGYFLAQLVAAIGVMVAASGYYTPGIHDARELAERVRSVSVLPAALLGILLGTLVVVRMTRRSFPDRPPADAFRAIGLSRGQLRDLAVSAALGLALCLLYVFLLSRLAIEPTGPLGPLVEAASRPGWQRDLWSLTAICFAPPIEEFLFRGVLFQGLATAWGTSVSATTVTVLFSLFHLPETISYWPAIIAVTIMAAIAMAIRLKTRSLGPSIALHAAYNAGLVLCVYTGIG